MNPPAKKAKPISQTSLSDKKSAKRAKVRQKKDTATHLIIKPLNITSIIIGSDKILKAKSFKRQNAYRKPDIENVSFRKVLKTSPEDEDEEEVFTFKEETTHELSKIYSTVNYSFNSLKSKVDHFEGKLISKSFNSGCLENLKKNMDPTCHYCRIF